MPKYFYRNLDFETYWNMWFMRKAELTAVRDTDREKKKKTLERNQNQKECGWHWGKKKKKKVCAVHKRSLYLEHIHAIAVKFMQIQTASFSLSSSFSSIRLAGCYFVLRITPIVPGFKPRPLPFWCSIDSRTFKVDSSHRLFPKKKKKNVRRSKYIWTRRPNKHASFWRSFRSSAPQRSFRSSSRPLIHGCSLSS